jgi:hypothetical protein
VETAVATAPLLIKDGSGGNLVDIIPVGSAVGTHLLLPFGVPCLEGIYLDQNGATGKIIPFVN